MLLLSFWRDGSPAFRAGVHIRPAWWRAIALCGYCRDEWPVGLVALISSPESTTHNHNLQKGFWPLIAAHRLRLWDRGRASLAGWLRAASIISVVYHDDARAGKRHLFHVIIAYVLL